MQQAARILLSFLLALILTVRPAAALAQADDPADQTGFGQGSTHSAPADKPKPIHDPVWDAQSTAGPVPPLEVKPHLEGASPSADASAVVLAEVPSYLWRHGCGPTAAAMVIGYWDRHGFDWLVPGDASTQTAAVNERIASEQGTANHYTDYVEPFDGGAYSPLPDKSEDPPGDEHASNSLADFMKTSWSAVGNQYGWSWFSDMTLSFAEYIHWIRPGFAVDLHNQYMSNASLTWETYRAEIDAGRPVVFLVDSDGDGITDHFVAAIGYSAPGGVQQYAALDTWDSEVQWYPFIPLTAGIPWGVYGAVTLSLGSDPVPALTSLDPAQAAAGDPEIGLTVKGTNFAPESIVRLDAADLDTTFIDAATLSARVPQELLTAAGERTVTVINPAPGSASNGLPFTVLNPVPVLAGLGVDWVGAGEDALPLAVTGSGFTPSSVVLWDGADLVTTYLGPTRLAALVPVAHLGLSVRGEVTVFTPPPGGGVSNLLTYQVGAALYLPLVSSSVR